MMQGLLSKEVLGPSLKDFVERLPPYIEENKDKLSKDDIERYENQKKLMEEVLTELNKEKETDTSEVKKEQFTKVLALMQKVKDMFSSTVFTILSDYFYSFKIMDNLPLN